MSKPNRPLVIRFGRVGDMVLLQPLLHRLHVRYGQPCDLLGVGKHSIELYRDQPDVAHVMSLMSHHRSFAFSPEQWHLVRALRQRQDAPIYVCEPQRKSLARIRTLLKLAHIPDSHCVFLNDVEIPEGAHWIDHLLMMADVAPRAFQNGVALGSVPSDTAPHFQVSARERIDCDQWLMARGLSGHPLVLMQPANKRTMRWNGVRQSSDDNKSWPSENWSRVAGAILAQLPDARVLLCGCPAEAPYLEQLRTNMMQPNVEIVAHDLPLPRLRALLAVADSMISVDTGPAHLAAAMDCPLVVLFGSMAPSYWAPRAATPGTVQVVGGPPRDRVEAIAPEEVIEAWRALRPLTQKSARIHANLSM